MKAIQPLNNRKHAALFNKDRGVIDLWLQSIQNFQDRNYNLIPVSVSLEVCHTTTSVPAPTHEQVLMEAWLAAIHGVKMIDWQMSNAAQNTNQVVAMREFTAAMATYDDLILGPDVSNPVTDNSNVRYNRVDTLTRQDGEYTYLFAARLTEPVPLVDETNHLPEPESITTTFTVPGLESGRADILNEQGKMTGEVLTIVNGEFQDTFNQCDVRIYRISDRDPGENYPPILSPIGNKTIKAGTNLSFTLSATDPEGQELEYSATNLPEGASLNSESGFFSWIPQKEDEGNHMITFAVSDGIDTDEKTITIEVIVVNLSMIEVTTPPAMINYFIGDELDLTGLVVTGTYEDNSTMVLPITMDNISGFDSSEPESDQVLTIDFEGKTATFTVNIINTDLFPDIEVRPGLNVEVNEEVLFTGEGTIYSDIGLLNKAVYEWDFGDGYVHKYGAPFATSMDGGMAVTHYYMKPGTFKVTLTVSIYNNFEADETTPRGAPIMVRSKSIQVNVTGEAPMAGFELMHAPFNARIAQFITATIPQAVASNSTNRLVVTLTGENQSTNTTLLDKAGLTTKEKFLLEQRNLPADNYRLVAELKNVQGNVLSVWKEKFSKPYDGIPKVGINEWNAICVNGDPFFPVTSFMLNKAANNESEPDFENFVGAINTTSTIGFYNETPNHNHTPVQWLDYLNSSEAEGWMGIGPARGTYRGNRIRQSRNSSLNIMKDFVNATKNHNALLMWDWMDEPNLGGRQKKVFPPVLSAWAYATREEDTQHPIACNSNSQDTYGYLQSIQYNARHTFFADVTLFDSYPLEYRRHPTNYNLDRGITDLWVEDIDDFLNNNLNMIPGGMFIEVCDIRSSTDTPAPTHDQVLMESWLAVVHGLKMISWFNFFEYDTIQYEALREFTKAMETYGQIILGPDNVEQIADNSNVRTNRVDTLTRKDGDDTYLFAVRLTEPVPLPDETNHQAPEKQEPDYITTTFTVPGLESGRADVLDELGQIIEVLAVENGQFIDEFGKEDYRIYRISDGEPGENLPPVFDNIGYKTVNAGSSLEFTISATDPNSDPLTYSASDLPAGASFDPATRTFSWTPQASQVGTYSVTFAVTDGVNPTVEKTITVNVVAVGETTAILSGPASIQSESVFTVTLGLNSNIGDVYAATFTLSYDSSLFTLESVDAAADSPIMIAAQDISVPGIIRLSVAGTTPIWGSNIALVDLHFRSNAISASQTTSVSISGAELGISDGSEYAAGTSSLSTLINLRASAEVANASAILEGGQVTITWTDPADAVFNGVKIVGEGGTVITPVLVDKGVQTATITGLTENIPYSFRIITLNSEGAESQGVIVTATTGQVIGDLNGDGYIRTGDLAMVAARYGVREGDADWAAARIADVNGDKVVDIADLVYIARRILNIQ